MIRFSNGIEVQTTSISGAAEIMRQHRRDVITITTTGITYADAAALFADGAEWCIVEMVDGNEIDYDYSSYTMAGSITDNRDGTLVIKMGRANTAEETLADELSAANAEIATLTAENETMSAQIDDLIVEVLEGGSDDAESV